MIYVESRFTYIAGGEWSSSYQRRVQSSLAAKIFSKSIENKKLGLIIIAGATCAEDSKEDEGVNRFYYRCYIPQKMDSGETLAGQQSKMDTDEGNGGTVEEVDFEYIRYTFPDIWALMKEFVWDYSL